MAFIAAPFEWLPYGPDRNVVPGLPGPMRLVGEGVLGDHWTQPGLAQAEPAPGAEHAATSLFERGERHHADGPVHVVVDRLHPTSHEVGLVPEPGAGRVAEEVFPPLLVGQLTGPSFE